MKMNGWLTTKDLLELLAKTHTSYEFARELDNRKAVNELDRIIDEQDDDHED